MKIYEGTWIINAQKKYFISSQCYLILSKTKVKAF